MDQNIQQANPIPPLPEQPKTFGWIKWVIVIVLVAIFSSGTTYLVFQTQSKKQIAKPQLTQTLPSTTPAPNLTTNWKTFNPKGLNEGYSIQYPPTWILEREYKGTAPNVNNFIRIFNPQTMIEEYGNGGYFGNDVPTEELFIEKAITVQTAEQYANSQNSNSHIESLNEQFLKGRKKIIINGLAAEVYPDVGEGSTGDNVVLVKNGTLITIHVVGLGSKTIDQVLSTFQLTQ